MSQSDFNDARVLRSDATILNLEEVRLLYANLEVGGNTPDDLETLQSIGDKLEAALGEYYTKVQSAMTKAQEAVMGGAPEAMAQTAVNILIIQLDHEFGQAATDDIVVTMDEWKWMKERWTKNTALAGNKVIRAKLLRINEVVKNAKGVKFVGKRIWIRGEPEPTDMPPTLLYALDEVASAQSEVVS